MKQAVNLLIDVLEESEEIVTYKEGKKLVGFCGYSKENSHKKLLKKKIYKIISNILRKSKKIKNKEAFDQYEKNYYLKSLKWLKMII